MQNDDIFSTLYPMQQDDNLFPREISLAMAYVPYQKISTLYEPANALRVGTLFPDLDKPLVMGR
ncbi:MAG: spore coat associated protein CotJA [Clostridia bacterium]|nr:spore coat associated protein CotJA [Clostridia bacterium]